ncbi:MAG: EAL domain-containing protein [Nakamurella sp.]
MPDFELPHEQQLSDVLSEFARTMVTDFPIQAILDQLIDRIVLLLPVTAAGVTLIGPDTLPRYVAASDPTAFAYEQLQTELRDGPCLLAYHSGEAVVVTDLRDDPRFPRFAPRALAAGMRAVLTFPLRHGELQLGALDLYRDTPGGMSAREMAIAQTLADVVSAYLINAQARQALEDSTERSRELSLHDGLTGLPNRTLMLERLEHAFQRTRRSDKTSAVVFVDLDGFKRVNDTHGHSVGNQLLVAVAMRLKRLLRPPDTVARMHGDEFVILCEDLDDPDQAAPIVARLTAAMAKPFRLPDTTITISASVGIAFADHDLHDPEKVLRNADAAMYQAKRRGSGLPHVFDPRYQHIATTSLHLEHDLRTALVQGQLHAVYQPIVNTGDRGILGFEALLRWTHPVAGTVPPATFIPLAESAGLIAGIGSWILRRACADRRRWQSLNPFDDLDIAVNISTQQLMSATFVDTVVAALEAEDTEPARLTLEITESVFVQDSERALIVLNDLKALGVRIALDDFGTGYSSLGHLDQFPVDIVKIDRSCVADLAHDRVSQIISTAVVQLAHALDMTVVAEGIETAEQHAQVVALGCDASQGFYYGRPMRVGDADELVRRSGGQRLPVLPTPRVSALPTAVAGLSPR